MLLALFLHMMLGAPTRPDGWQFRTDAKPYLSVMADGKPIHARPLDDGTHLEPGWEVHVRTTPHGNDDWRAKFILNRSVISFHNHSKVWPSDDWVYYQMLGRLKVEGGKYHFGIGFLTAHAGIGCFGDLRVGGASVVQVDVKTFFAKREGGFSGRDELLFTGPVSLEPGEYDGVVTVGCHPGKMGTEIPSGQVVAWKSSRFFLLEQEPGSAMRPMKISEVSHVTR